MTERSSDTTKRTRNSVIVDFPETNRTVRFL